MREDIRQVKNALRLKIKNMRRDMRPDYKRDCDILIANQFLRSTSYTRSNVILTYSSTSIEVDTSIIIQTALDDGKRVACPRCIDGTRLMNFYYINSLEDLLPGSFGVLEPIANEANLYTGADCPICIVPGLAFDHWGYRLGYGKGYYDRFLADYGGWTVGLCYGECIEYKLPHGRFDRPVDRLITEKFTRRCIDNRPRHRRLRHFESE